MDDMKNEKTNVPDNKSFMLSNFDISYAVAVVVGFLILVLFIVLRKRSSSRKDFLLIGLSDSGKSAIFVSLLHRKFPQTFVSVKENIGIYKSGGLSCRIIDIPGHYRVRNKYFNQYKCFAKGVVFVLDSVTIQKDLRDVADALYTILTDSVIVPCSVLILCNKQDLATSKSAQLIKDLLEKEMNLIRDTRSRKLQTVGGEEEGNDTIFLGKPGKDFEWSQIPQNIQFFECSAKENQLENLTDWIDRML